MIFDECYEMLAKLDNVRLKKIENYNVSKLTFRLVYIYKRGDVKSVSVFEHIVKMFMRCIANRNNFQGTGNILCYCSRPMTAIRSDHLENFLKVTALLANKMIMYGTKLEGVTLRRIRTFSLPFIWNHQLKKCLGNAELRWLIIRDIYSAYMDFLEYKYYEKRNKLQIKGVLVLEETIASSQFLISYFKNRGDCCVSLAHGLYAANEQTAYYMSNWSCDYLLVYSQYALEMLKESGGYSGEIVVAGMFHFIGQNLLEREIKEIHKIGIFLDGALGDETKRINLEMIQTVIKACEDMDVEIVVKLHPSNSVMDLDFYKEKIDLRRNIHFYLKTPSSIEIERQIDVFICRDTTCLFEAVFQGIPSFVYIQPPGLYSNIPEDIYFRTTKDLREHLKRIESGTADMLLKKVKDYLCGYSDPKLAYRNFFKSIDWEIANI